MADDQSANWLLKSDWSAVVRRLALACRTSRKQHLPSDELLPLWFKPTRRQRFAHGSLLLAAPCSSWHLIAKRGKRFEIQEAARRSIPRSLALSGSCSDSLIAPSFHHHRLLLPSPTSPFLCFTPLMNSAAHFKEAAVIKAQRDSQDQSNLCTLERLNKHVSVICCPCIGGFS